MYIITKFTKGMFLAQTHMGESSVGLQRFAAIWIVPGAKCHWALSKPSLTSSRMKHRARHVAAHQLCVHTHTGRKRQYCPWDPASGRKRTCQDMIRYVMLARSMWNRENFTRGFGVRVIAVLWHAVTLFCWYQCLHMSKQCQNICWPTLTEIKWATSHF